MGAVATSAAPMGCSWAMKLRLLLVAAALLGTAVVTASTATAATTIGYLAPGTPQPSGEHVIVAFSPGPIYTVPSAGVITSWSVNGGTPAPFTGRMALQLFHVETDPHGGQLTASVVGASKPLYVPAGVSTQVSQVPVAGGEQLGVYFPDPGPVFPSGLDSTACSGDLVDGATYVEGQNLSCENGRAVNITATVEPDADGDRFGDETQDRCPGIPGTAGGCHPRYKGKGGAGRLFELRFGTRYWSLDSEKPTTVIEGNRYEARFKCSDGFRMALIFFGGIEKGSPIPVKADGSFGYARGVAHGNGLVGGRIEIAGRLLGPTATGTAKIVVRDRRHGTCKSGRFSWRIHGR